MDALAHRRRLEAEDPGDFRRRHVLEVAEHERIAIQVGQPVDRVSCLLGERLTIAVPECATGLIIPPPARDDKISTAHGKLPTWQGTPFWTITSGWRFGW